MSEGTIWLTIFFMALVTVIPRMLPVWLLAGRNLPPLVVAWLRYVPVAVLAAMLAQYLLLHDNRFDLSWSNLYFWVGLPTIVVAWKTRSMFVTVIFGMGVIALVRYFLS